MSKKFLALVLLMFLTACGGSGTLRNLDDACSISKQRPDILRAMQRSQSKWGVPVAVQMATIWQESKGAVASFAFSRGAYFVGSLL